jgi:predicted HAD superfamily Cof-like phosphohydrolase
MLNAQSMVLDFHRKQGHYVGKRGLDVPTKVKLLRARLVVEEAAELVAAIHEDNEVAIADAIGDLLYVVLGTAVAYDMPADRIFDEVHASNMSKGKPNKHGKGGKGKKFRKPNMGRVLFEAARFGAR